MPFVKANQASRYYNVSTATIRKYAREKSIHTEKLESGQYRYWIAFIRPLFRMRLWGRFCGTTCFYRRRRN